jgi:catechol 2,3-dioxygenase-like lactoylglutathione lyase family enzyme
VRIIGLDHVQLAMPAGREDEARRFYSGLLGLPEKAKPTHLVAQLRDLVARVRDAGHSVIEGEPVEGYDHVYVDDPFGNRIELLERV